MPVLHRRLHPLSEDAEVFGRTLLAGPDLASLLALLVMPG